MGCQLPPFVLAEPIGKATTKLPAKVPGAQATAKEAAARKGADPSEAAASVLRHAVRHLPIPNAADDCESVARARES